MNRKRKTQESLHLPEEILEDILVRIPVKSLLRLRCVSKSWLSLIDRKQFIETHLKYSTKNQRVIIYAVGKLKQCSLSALMAGTDPSPLGSSMSLERVSFACCVVCVYQNKRFRLLNPYTRVSNELPEDPEIDNSDKLLDLGKFGFGWDESSGAYKVFAAWNRVREGPTFTLGCRARVYSSKTNSWKPVEDPYLRSTVGEGKFVSGKLHWISKRRLVISSFDLESEVFGTIELPDQTNDSNDDFFLLGVVRECLCLSLDYDNGQNNGVVLWVMKEYGVTESWEKLATIRLTDGPRGPLWPPAEVIGETANGEILIAFGVSVLVYCPRKDVIHRREIGMFSSAHLCVESLVSPVRWISSLNI